MYATNRVGPAFLYDFGPINRYDTHIFDIVAALSQNASSTSPSWWLVTDASDSPHRASSGLRCNVFWKV